MRRAASILALTLAGCTAHAWTPLLLDSPAVMAFVLSDRFWPTVFTLSLAFGAIAAAASAALVFHPGSLSGRTGPEGGE